MIHDANDALKHYFGYSAFRPGQDQVVEAILHKRDVLCVMPTGAGKSVCYQVPALIFDGITLVISPLISLMKDQVRSLTQSGIPAAYLNSSLTAGQYARVLENIRGGMYKIVYVAPERLTVSDFLRACAAVRIDLLAVDEAHCISQWGQDFRPSYLKITDFVSELRCRPVIAAFTATATAEVKEDIERSLRLREPFRITTGFDRPNLKFEVIRAKNKEDTLLKLLKERSNSSGIVYCATRRTVEEVAEALNDAGFSATMYHAGLSAGDRKENQEDFVYDRKSIMVATNAFGMGIDKSNVAFVIHYNMPKDVESYYQEAGRAGRDGTNAECILLYSPGDVQINRFLIEHSEPNPELTEEQQELLRKRDHDRLKQMTFYSTTSACLRNFILRYFGEKAPHYCGNCSNCLSQFQEVDITVDAQKLLSCIKRTGERFGKKMISDILRGSGNERLLRMGLDRQTTYGLMKGYTEPQVRDLLDYLEFNGYIETRGKEYPTLSVAPKANAVLFGRERIIMKQMKPKEAAPAKAKKKKAAGSVDGSLLAKLKVLRRKLADEREIPPYMVFSDATLAEMCRLLPATPEEFLEVPGVGRVKLERYGERFLGAIQAHLRQKGTG